MALHLSGLIKTKNVVLGLISLSHHVFGEENRRKRGEGARVPKDQALVRPFPHLFLLRGQTTYKKRFEEVQGKKNQNPNLIF